MEPKHDTNLGDEIAKQQERSAGKVDQVASALHQTSEDLADTLVAPYVEKAADALDKLSGSIRQASLQSLIRSAQDLARRDPLLFLGGAFTLGLLAARVLKSGIAEAAPPPPKRRKRKRAKSAALAKTRKTRGGNGHGDH